MRLSWKKSVQQNVDPFSPQQLLDCQCIDFLQILQDYCDNILHETLFTESCVLGGIMTKKSQEFSSEDDIPGCWGRHNIETGQGFLWVQIKGDIL